MNTRTEALLVSAELEPLLDRLVGYLGTGTEKADFLIDREMLSSVVCMASLVYDGVRYLADAASKSTFHEFREPLARVIDILKCDANQDDIFIALGAPAMLAMSPDQTAMSRAVERYEAVLRALDDIARAVPPPLKHDRGRPPMTRDLRAMVELLVGRWEAWTGNPVKQIGHKKEAPSTPAKKFVYDVVEFIDPARLGELPGVLEKVTDHRPTIYAK